MSQLVREWISCNSPLLLVEKNHLDAWEGTDVPSQGRIVEARFRWNSVGPATDYDRACDVDDYLGLIEVGRGKGIVLGDEPLMTAWLPLVDGGLLIRWVYAEDEETILSAAKNIPNDCYKDSGVTLAVGEHPLVLFAACESSSDQVYPRVEFKIPSGYYRILTSRYEPDANTSLLCHRLQLEARSPNEARS